MRQAAASAYDPLVPVHAQLQGPRATRGVRCGSSTSAPVGAKPEPEMRGCEGYKPNLAAWADGGLQSSSTELKGPQAVARSSTRLHGR